MQGREVRKRGNVKVVKKRGGILTPLVPGQRQILKKLSRPIMTSQVCRENDISQNNVQGGNSRVCACKCSATFPRRMDQATDGERGKHRAKETASHWHSTQALVRHRHSQSSHNAPGPQDPEGPSA